MRDGVNHVACEEVSAKAGGVGEILLLLRQTTTATGLIGLTARGFDSAARQAIPRGTRH